jgi:thymidylate synthase (FAD)
MKIIEPSIEILTPIDGNSILKHIELCSRTCYKSEDCINDESAERLVKNLITRGHTAMLEHVSVSVKVVCDRGVSHEIVRHRIASYAQESTRYCNYSKDKFDGELTFIKPCFFTPSSFDSLATYQYDKWYEIMRLIENEYLSLIESGCKPEEARSILPNSLKTEIVITMNLREWIHFFNLRYVGTTGNPHPQMKQVSGMILRQFKNNIPIIFDDILEDGNNE